MTDTTLTWTALTMTPERESEDVLLFEDDVGNSTVLMTGNG